MSEQARFQEWWESTGTNSVILRAQAWSAWQAAITQTAPDQHIALMEAEYDDRMPQPAEDPDEWVIQDKVPPRAHIDVVFWSHWTHGEEVVAQGTWEHPQVHGFTDCFGHQLSVRCRRRDLPKVEQVKSGSGSVDSFSAWKREQFCKAFGIEQKPQPKKTMLRLWIDSDCNIHAGLRGDGDLELHYDHETRQFYTEE